MLIATAESQIPILMTSREARKQRREAERQARQAEYRRELEARRAETNRTEADRAATRAEINRANAQLSTGPRTPQGKARSSQNSFKHGLYSKHLVMPGEDPAELDSLKAGLIAEHQPVNDTESILVNELAEHFWRIRRMRRLEAEAFRPEKLAEWHSSGFLAQIGRIMAAAERGFHKALSALRQLQAARGFVPQIRTPTVRTETPTGFVPQNARMQPATDHSEPENQSSVSDGNAVMKAIASQRASETRTEHAQAASPDDISSSSGFPQPRDVAWASSRHVIDPAA